MPENSQGVSEGLSPALAPASGAHGHWDGDGDSQGRSSEQERWLGVSRPEGEGAVAGPQRTGAPSPCPRTTSRVHRGSVPRKLTLPLRILLNTALLAVSPVVQWT